MRGLVDQIAQEHLTKVKVKDDYIAAACPFHGGGQERHASFWLNRTTGHWGCFTCQVTGPDLSKLLQDLGVSNSKIEAELAEAKEASAKTFQISELVRKKKSIASFKGTHVLPEALLGVFDYLPISLVEQGFPEELLQDHDIGYDKRNSRMTFPIRDAYGSLVGISGRATVPGESPKYLIYNGMRDYEGKKYPGELGDWCPGYANDNVRNHLWRAHFVHEDFMADRWDQLIIVEGYKAALWMVKHGWHHTVATMGTKMTKSQERLIKRWGATVFILTDNNPPGREAAAKWGKRLAATTMPVYNVHYPDYCKDSDQPDDLTCEELEMALSNAERIGGYYGRMERKQKIGHSEKKYEWQ